MRLKATIRQPHATPPERHVQITADATATAGDVARALVASGEVAAVGASADVTFRIAGTGQELAAFSRPRSRCWSPACAQA